MNVEREERKPSKYIEERESAQIATSGH